MIVVDENVDIDGVKKEIRAKYGHFTHGAKLGKFTISTTEGVLLPEDYTVSVVLSDMAEIVIVGSRGGSLPSKRKASLSAASPSASPLVPKKARVTTADESSASASPAQPAEQGAGFDADKHPRLANRECMVCLGKFNKYLRMKLHGKFIGWGCKSCSQDLVQMYSSIDSDDEEWPTPSQLFKPKAKAAAATKTPA